MIAVIYISRMKDQILIRLAINTGKCHRKIKTGNDSLKVCQCAHTRIKNNLQTSLGMFFPMIVIKEA